MVSKFKRLAGAAAAAAMIATPVAASAAPRQAAPARVAAPAPAAKLSVARAGSPTAHGSKLSALGGSTLINLGIFAAIVAGVLVATTTGGDDSPDSP